MSFLWRRAKTPELPPVQDQGRAQAQPQPLIDYHINPGMEGCEQGGVVFYPKETDTGTGTLFLATDGSPTNGIPLTIQQILLTANIRRAAWYLHNGELILNQQWLERLNLLRTQKQLPVAEHLAENEALVMLAEMVAKSREAIELRLKNYVVGRNNLTLPTLLYLLQQIQDALPLGLAPLTTESFASPKSEE